MPVSEESLDTWIRDVGESRETEVSRWEENFTTVMAKEDLGVKVMEVGDTPRLMTDVKDASNILLLRKYDLLNKQIWPRLRSHPGAPQVYFVCEKPIRVVETYNMEFFNYEDYQFLGAYLAEKGKHKSANWLFTEALKSETADAYINKGIYHYRSGDQGIYDNLKLAKRHIEKGLTLIVKMRLSEQDEKIRRKVCWDTLYEIDYDMAGGFVKVFKNFIRLITFNMKKEIFYIGNASRKILSEGDTHKSIADTITKYELQMLKDAAESFLYRLKLEVPIEMDELSMSLDGLVERVRKAESEADLAEHGKTIGQIFMQVTETHSRLKTAKDEAAREESISVLDRLSAEEKGKLKKFDASFSLKSPRELADMAMRKGIEPDLALWLYKERSHIKMIMEALFQNSTISADIKKEIGKRLKLESGKSKLEI